MVIARGIAASVIIASSAAALYAERGTLRTGMNALWHASPAWVAVGAALEFVSMAAFVLLQHGLLKAAGATPAFTWLLAADYASNAVAAGIPIAGSGLAAATTARQFRRHGIDPAAIRLTLGLAGVISTIGFAVIAGVGAVLTGNLAGAGVGLLTSCGSAAAIAFLVIAAHSPGGRARLAPVAAWVLRLAKRIARRPAGDPGVIAARAIGRIGALKLGPWSVGYQLSCGLMNWAADALCLAAAVAAVGGPVPWGKLVLVWSAGVGATTFSPTPFGLGVVEVALIAALAAAGISSPQAVGAVLLYRIITFKLAGLIWVTYLRLHERRQSGNSD
jgi:uncharacterized membrane protein YbhN (UPF0104 family)